MKKVFLSKINLQDSLILTMLTSNNLTILCCTTRFFFLRNTTRNFLLNKQIKHWRHKSKFMGKKHQTNLIKKEKRPLYTETNVLGN